MKHILTFFLLLTVAANAQSGFTEPPAILYGKVVHVGNGASYQVFDGALQVTLGNTDQSVTLATVLTPTGAADAFSYRLEVPQRFLPTSDQAALSVGAAEASFNFTAITVDGSPAEPLDSSQALLTTSFSNRAQEHRLDLKVTLPQPDSDNDAIPDWWEELHGLNPLFAGDATDDPDADTLTNLDEFNRGTDPNASNLTATLATTGLFVPSGGRGGLHLQIIDADTAPADIPVNYRTAVPGLTFYHGGALLDPDTDFSYADILAGNITVQADLTFTAATVTFSIADGGKHDVLVTAFSPATLPTTAPALWLDTENFASGASWPDSTPNNRDAYQPFPDAQPATPALDGTSDFFYIDDRDLAVTTGAFSAYAAFDITAFQSDHATLFAHSDLHIAVGGTSNADHAQSLYVLENHRETPGPVVPAASALQLSLTSRPTNTALAVSGAPFSFSSPVDELLDPAFATLGASHPVAELEALDFLHGTVSEFILYTSPLDSGPASRVEDYQLARWSGHHVWDLRAETAPLTLTGSPGARNSLNGGWAADTLTGGNLDDTLRGGPGDNTLTGGPGADRFQLFPHLNHDTITDFDETQGDTIDLTAIFGTATGTPDTFLNIRVQAYRDASGFPAVKNILELDYAGDGGQPDQTITLTGARYSNTDLPRLVGENIICLGGPQFPVQVALATAATDITETVVPRTLTLTRSGNLAAALTVPISFVGTADLATDYQLDGTASETGVVVEAQFARGESTTTIDLTPVQDLETETENILVTPLYRPGLTANQLQLNLFDAPVVTLASLVTHAVRSTNTPGTIQLNRTGPVTEPLAVSLNISGSAENGTDYQSIPTTYTIPVGTSDQTITIQPTSTPSDAKVATLDIDHDPTRFTLGDPSQASVVMIDATRSFPDFLATNFPGNTDPSLPLKDSEDDSLTNTLEYLLGTDPNAPNPHADAITLTRLDSGHVEITLTADPTATDATIAIQDSLDLTAWLPATPHFTHRITAAPDNKIRHTYLSKSPVPAPTFYRVSVTVPDLH